MSLEPSAIQISELMTPSPNTVGLDQTLATARKRMYQAQIRHLPVLHGGELVGLLSARDIALVESLSGIDIETVPVEEAMTRDPFTVAPSTTLAKVAGEMAEHKLGTAVVVDNGRVVGIFTTTDALAVLARG